MRISDPNKLVGRVMSVKAGQDMTEIVIDVGDQAVTATITKGAFDAMNLSEGDEIFAMFNSTSVSLIRGDVDEHHRDNRAYRKYGAYGSGAYAGDYGVYGV
ncbi:hypothetical protein SYNTR_1590 [Candidatus Syntrophocurvum alkaliphilum]|uniref:Mop domain-containing protein n=1 Tax=Candidatus Syntrophocurvum alkaliphilum TaxID=2293317 RepID=A0A6I6DJA4_9FIRM|nr:TOBE domain-containing protein [Candidatus Syntrophocurvum alkaliphilum]QGU00184.1 hypothetical protein SYNTR_1590 [Candidatus Syntrophocurvum alkaliphilum]